MLGIVGAEEEHGAGDLLGVADAAERMILGGDTVRLGPVVPGEARDGGRPGPARRYRVDTDLVGGELHRLVAGDLQDGGLARRVEGAAALALLASDAAEIDDGAAAAPAHLRHDLPAEDGAAHHIEIERG